MDSFSTQNDPFTLKHCSLIVTVIVYGVPSIEVSVFNWILNMSSGHVLRITNCLFAYVRVCKLSTCLNIILFI